MERRPSVTYRLKEAGCNGSGKRERRWARGFASVFSSVSPCICLLTPLPPQPSDCTRPPKGICTLTIPIPRAADARTHHLCSARHLALHLRRCRLDGRATNPRTHRSALAWRRRPAGATKGADGTTCGRRARGRGGLQTCVRAQPEKVNFGAASRLAPA